MLTEEQKTIQALARDFAKKEIEPVVDYYQEKKEFPLPLWQKLKEVEFTGMPFPEKYGGGGTDFFSFILVLEEISKADAGVAVALAVHTSAVSNPIYHFGTEEQKQKYLTKLTKGDIIGAFALTEPNYGSDAGSIQTSAKSDDDYYILNGRKQWISTAQAAGLFLVFARTDKEIKGPKGITAFLVPKDTAGLTVTSPYKKLGLWSSCTNDLILEDCKVPVSNILGNLNEGFKIAMWALDGGRIGVAAQALGIATAALEASINYSKQREQFGKRIGDFEAIQWKIADMATEISAARLLTYRAAWLKDRGLPCTKESAMAKLFASRVARYYTSEAIQIHGGYGYMAEFPLERYYRDAKVTEIYEGTSEIQKIIISRELITIPASFIC